jgi:undecaprenyl-diphosphatase
LQRPLQGKASYLKTAVILGVAQAFAAFPGVSRSGITLTFARMLKIRKEVAVEYSFLMAVPVILGGVLWKSLKMAAHPQASTLPAWPYVVVGVLTSCLVGLLAIHGLLLVLRKWGAGIFAGYRLLLALIIWRALLR